MKEFRKTFFVLAILLIPLISIISCREEIAPMDNYDWEPGMAMPIAHASLTLGDLIPDDGDNFVTDNEGLIHFYFREDSVIGFSVHDILDIPSQQDEEMIFKLGEIDLDNFGPITTIATVNEMLDMLDTNLAQSLQILNGTNAIFPSMTSNSSKDFNFDNFDAFEYVTFSSGELILKVTNMLPITFSSCSVSLHTVTPEGISIYIGDFTFIDFLSFSDQTETLGLNGITLYNDFLITINSFTTLESQAPVLVDLSNGLEFVISSSNIKVIAGKAKIPEQTISTQGDTIDLSVAGNERLTFLALNEASINYSIESSIDLGLNFSIVMPDVTIDGIPVEFNFSAMNQSSGSLDLSNSLFDLTQNSEQPYNNFQMIINFDVDGTDQWIEFDSSSTIRMQYSIGEIEFELAQGWIGVHKFIIDPDSVYTGFNELENLSGSLIFTNPELKILVTNNIGLPVGFGIDINSYTNEGNSVGLNADMLQFPYPTVPYTQVDSFIALNNQTSNLSEFLAFMPDYFLFGGDIETNPDSANTGIVYNNFVTRDGQIQLGLEFELPVSMTISNLQFSDTLDFSMEDLNFEDAVSGHFSVYTINGLPLEATVYLTFVDSIDFIPVDMYEINLLEAAIVDINGVVTSAVPSTSIIEMDSSKFDNLSKANKIMITATFNTSNNETQDVSFYTDYTLDIHLAALINYQFEIE